MQLRIAIDYIEVRGGVKVMAEAFGRKLAAERSVIFMFQILVHLNVPLLFICRIIRNYLLKGRHENRIKYT